MGAEIFKSVRCDYCGGDAPIVTGADVYPHRPDLSSKWFYKCDPCGAYVGCHPGTTKPLGRLADADLRAAKKKAHAAFDPVWQTGDLSRGEAYAWLASELGITKDACHIGMFDAATCARVVTICKEISK